MQRRREARTRAVLPVKVLSQLAESAPSRPACTLDVAYGGARLGGLRYEGMPGAVLALERGNRRLSFRVAWVGAKGTAREDQLGLESIGPLRGFWGVNLPALQPCNQTSSPAAAEQPAQQALSKGAPLDSASMRYRCPGNVQLQEEGASTPLYGKLWEIGMRGCYVLTLVKLPLHAHVRLSLRTQTCHLQARAVVRTEERTGMWLEFLPLHDEESVQLHLLINHLAGSAG